MKLKFKDALESDSLPSELKARLKKMEKGIQKSGSFKSIPLKKVGDLGLEIPSFETLKGYADSRGVKFEASDMDRVKIAIGSTEFVDHDGDIVRQNFDYEVFSSNPAMPFCHNWENLPVGVHLHEEVKQIKTADYEGPALVLTSLYSGEAGGQLAGEVFHAVDKGFLKGNSVGILPLEISFIEDEEQRKELGLGRWGVVIERSQLLECSPCLIPANPMALVDAKASKNLDKTEFALILESIRAIEEKSLDDSWKSLESDYKKIGKLLFPDIDLDKTPEELVKSSLKKKSRTSKTFEPLDLEAVIKQYEKASMKNAELETSVDALRVEVEALKSKIEKLGSKSLSDSSDESSDDSELSAVVNVFGIE